MVSVKVLLYSRWSYFLQVSGQQNICGVRTKDEYCVLEMKTTDFSKVTIRGVRANAYIAMNAQGNLYATDSENPSCVWREIHHTDGYNYYQSDIHSQYYLGLKRKGDPKTGSKTALGQVGCGFLLKSAN